MVNIQDVDEFIITDDSKQNLQFVSGEMTLNRSQQQNGEYIYTIEVVATGMDPLNQDKTFATLLKIPTLACPHCGRPLKK